MLPLVLPRSPLVAATVAAAIAVCGLYGSHGVELRQASTQHDSGWVIPVCGALLCGMLGWAWSVGLNGLVTPSLRVEVVQETEQRRTAMGGNQIPRATLTKCTPIVSCATLDPSRQSDFAVAFHAIAPGAVKIYFDVPRKRLTPGAIRNEWLQDAPSTLTFQFQPGDSQIPIPRIDLCQKRSEVSIQPVTQSLWSVVALFKPSAGCHHPEGLATTMVSSVVCWPEHVLECDAVDKTSSVSSTPYGASHTMILSPWSKRLLVLKEIFDPINGEQYAETGMQIDSETNGSKYTIAPCSICFDAGRLSMMMPCRHRCVCHQCLAQMVERTCPICRAPVEYVFEEVVMEHGVNG